MLPINSFGDGIVQSRKEAGPEKAWLGLAGKNRFS